MRNVDRILNNDTDNCLFPFLWLSGGETKEEIEDTVERIYLSGCRAFCVEPRCFDTFAKDWWGMLDIIFVRAEKHGMKVVIVDEDTVPPTGHAYGLVAKSGNEKLRRMSLVEAHTDVFGPREIDLVVGESSSEMFSEIHDELIGVYGYQRIDSDDSFDISTPVDLMKNISQGILNWYVPKGAYRIVYLYKTFKYSNAYNDTFIDFLNTKSVDLLVENIYNDYEKRYGHMFGKTFAGFFSDEPALGNCYMYDGSHGTKGYCETRIGTIGETIAYTEEVKKRMDARLGCDCRPMMPALWYYDDKVSPIIRSAYMNVVSELYRETFSERLGAWCKKRGLLYIGHVLEDNNLHCRTGHGTGHYFRSQQGQDMPGIDIVLHQVIPGASKYKMSGTGDHLMDGEFYHYILGKLNSSAAHTYPEYKGRAMCEVSIGYGWAEGTRLLKWLFDFLLVRGSNRFVPGSVRPVYPDDVHAPHFGSMDRNEPQFEGVCELLGYVKKVSTLLCGEHIASAAVLYHAQGEWMNDFNGYMLMQKPAKELYDNHVDFDILCEDLLEKAEICGKKIKVGSVKFDCIVVPYAKYLPRELIGKLHEIVKKGGKIVFIDALPENCEEKFETVKLGLLAEYFIVNGFTDVKVEGFPLLRHIHYKNDGDAFMFFNEDELNVFDGEIDLGIKGNCNIYDFAGNVFRSENCEGKLALRLEPYESAVIIFEKDRGYLKYVPYTRLDKIEIESETLVSLYSVEDPEKKFAEYTQKNMIPISKKYPAFSGRIIYESKFSAPKTKTAFLRFERIGENAELFLNGTKCGLRVCPPYVFDVSKILKEGENDIELIVRTTLANYRRDAVSMYLPLEPTGVGGKVELYYE